MPIYEYRCADCGADHEITQRMAADPLTLCPTCGEERLERLVSASSFALKGGGWYADGYGEGKKAPSDETKPKADADSTSDKKPDKKPSSSGSTD